MSEDAVEAKPVMAISRTAALLAFAGAFTFAVLLVALHFIKAERLLGPRASQRPFESRVEVGHDPGRTLDSQECFDMDSREGRHAWQDVRCGNVDQGSGVADTA
jgi:hypothetical protein